MTPETADITRLPHMDATHISYDSQQVLVPHLWCARHGAFTVDWANFGADAEGAVSFEDGTLLVDLLGIRMVRELNVR
jgi:hypothetical protein